MSEMGDVTFCLGCGERDYKCECIGGSETNLDDGIGLVHISEAEYAKLKQAEAELSESVKKSDNLQLEVERLKHAIRTSKTVYDLNYWKARFGLAGKSQTGGGDE